ncbi:putative RDD family membrane protein YckC [Nocardioides sp. BE266]|uniref:RDD family protein n=1 Tax=Nocardioides sp. BE266 TaxID=2817725 RepID=UPI0028547278|nr:RDD family protein [Nocardioides sp. BE266]MDR7255178.1 putative RDD family membrane protein YckC [Nocardioides sp. BE266]
MPQPDPTPAPTDLIPASWGRRILALLVDWLSSWAVAQLLAALGVVADDPSTIGSTGTLILVVEMALFTALLGGSFGKLVTRIRVVRHDDPSRPVSLLRAVVRTVLTFLIIPPLLTFDGRGLHDLAAGTRTVRI